MAVVKPLYPPSLTIAGTEYVKPWDGTSVVGLGGLRVVWGRDDIYDPPRPSQMTFDVIDPTAEGSWAGVTRNGQEVILSRTSPTVILFRGFITEAMRRPRRIRNPRTGQRDMVWVTTITAVDKTADLDQLVIPGTATLGLFSYPRRFNCYTEQNPENLWAAGASKYLKSYQRPNAPFSYKQRVRPADTALSVMETFQRRNALLGICWTVYRPDQDHITWCEPEQQVGVRLVRDPVTWNLSLAGSIDTQTVLPASALEIDDDAGVRSPLSVAVTEVQVNYFATGEMQGDEQGNRWATIDPAQMVATGRTNAYRDNSPSSRKVIIDTEMQGKYNSNDPEPAPLLVQRAVGQVNKLNGRASMPPCRIDINKLAPTGLLLERIMRTRTESETFYIAGSIFTVLPGVGPTFHLIGGAISYDDGWIVEPTFGPTYAYVTPPALTVDQLVTFAGPTLSQFDPSITLADLGHVSIGVTS